jgi:hypothetical protein
MPSYTLDLDRRTDAFIELLGCPVRWSSKEYVMSLANYLVMRCEDGGRPDLSDRIRAKVSKIDALILKIE